MNELAPRRPRQALMIAALADMLDLQFTQAEVLQVLWSNAGRELTARQLGSMVSAHRPITRGALHERIRCIRRQLGDDVIDTPSGSGRSGIYRLSPTGRALCAEALSRSADLLRAGLSKVEP